MIELAMKRQITQRQLPGTGGSRSATVYYFRKENPRIFLPDRKEQKPQNMQKNFE
jgi:hypothetical protein